MINKDLIKKALQKKVREIELTISETPFPFLLTYGVIDTYCSKNKIQLGQIGDAAHLTPLFFTGLDEGCKIMGVKNPFDLATFRICLEAKDIQVLSETFAEVMPQDEPTEGEEPTEGNEANQ